MRKSNTPSLSDIPRSPEFPRMKFKVTQKKIGNMDATIEEISQGFLDISKFIIEFIKANPILALKNPNIVSYALSAQKVLLDKQRVQIEESALKLGMAKMFGGFAKINPPPPAVEAEIIEDSQLVAHLADVKKKKGVKRSINRDKITPPPKVIPEAMDENGEPKWKTPAIL